MPGPSASYERDCLAAIAVRHHLKARYLYTFITAGGGTYTAAQMASDGVIAGTVLTVQLWGAGSASTTNGGSWGQGSYTLTSGDIASGLSFSIGTGTNGTPGTAVNTWLKSSATLQVLGGGGTGSNVGLTSGPNSWGARVASASGGSWRPRRSGALLARFRLAELEMVAWVAQAALRGRLALTARRMRSAVVAVAAGRPGREGTAVAQVVAAGAGSTDKWHRR